MSVLSETETRRLTMQLLNNLPKNLQRYALIDELLLHCNNADRLDENCNIYWILSKRKYTKYQRQVWHFQAHYLFIVLKEQFSWGPSSYCRKSITSLAYETLQFARVIF